MTDPVSVYNVLREKEPITWIDDLNMYFVTGHKDIVAILQDSDTFVTGTEKSTIYDTFGLNILTAEGDVHARFKGRMRPPFMPRVLRDSIQEKILTHVDNLIDGFAEHGQVEFREAFASRLPILTILSFLGIDLDEEADFRDWYNSFEEALANLTWVEDIRTEARRNIGKLHERLQEHIERYRQDPDESAFISFLANSGQQKDSFSDEEIIRNLSMVAFGGISTVEALLLNTLYCLSSHAGTMERVRADFTLIPRTLEEVIRYIGPVQSAHRYVAKDNKLLGVNLKKGDVVNCLLVAANHDPRVFNEPHRFNIDREDIRHHVGFAVGRHHCLGAHMARLEARISLERLLARLPNCRMNPDNQSVPVGHEFRQPVSLDLVWDRWQGHQIEGS